MVIRVSAPARWSRSKKLKDEDWLD